MVVLPAFPLCHCVQDYTNDTIVAIKKVVIKDTILVLTPANIKGFIVMTLLGLEYMHHTLSYNTHLLIGACVSKRCVRSETQ
ncbi:unnamed protein product [Oncorhynchus mykiss]|uniref:Uncharacterized protein n=1 Tax=Oncorhynchus mykiss TaxID=8022 RepID=A0A060X7M8_ONCMY|nr:unnamed protein product [Oncorhynchus mykiss]